MYFFVIDVLFLCVSVLPYECFYIKYIFFLCIIVIIFFYMYEVCIYVK